MWSAESLKMPSCLPTCLLYAEVSGGLHVLDRGVQHERSQSECRSHWLQNITSIILSFETPAACDIETHRPPIRFAHSFRAAFRIHGQIRSNSVRKATTIACQNRCGPPPRVKHTFVFRASLEPSNLAESTSRQATSEAC